MGVGNRKRGLWILLLVAAGALFAQSYLTTRSVHGTVFDPNGKAVAGAAVKITDTKTLQVRSYITGPEGGYAFHGLSANVDYEIMAQHGEKRSDTKRLSRFNSRKEAEIDLRLKS